MNVCTEMCNRPTRMAIHFCSISLAKATIIAQWNESSQGIIAVDDLRVHPGYCPYDHTDPASLHDFENNGSDFDVVDGGIVDWDTMNTGEQVDHTLGTMKGASVMSVLL